MSTAFPKDREFLLPASPLFIALSLFVALLLDWLPWSGIWLTLRPDFVALVLLFWCTHKPHRIGIGIAWAMGILSDVADASLFPTAVGVNPQVTIMALATRVAQRLRLPN